MKYGNWVPIDKSFVRDLPINRPYTGLEAMYSLTVDYDNGKLVTVTGYMHLWRWSKGKVLRFLDRIGAEIVYPHSTAKKRNQSGLITVHKPDLNRTNNGLKRMINSKYLETETDLKRTKTGLKTDLKRYTTIYPDPNPNPGTKKHTASDDAEIVLFSKKGKKLSGKKLQLFNSFWGAFNYKKGKAEAVDAWLDIEGLDTELVGKIMAGAEREAAARPELLERGLTPKMAQGWLSGRRWEDEVALAHRRAEPFNDPGYYDE